MFDVHLPSSFPPLKCGTRECSSHFAKPDTRSLNFLRTSSLGMPFFIPLHVQAAMALHHVQHSTRSMRAPSIAALAALESALSSLRISNSSGLQRSVIEGRRNASHAAQGRANKAKQGPGKRLGAKKSGGEYVVPGNILFKQRGTLWFPGDGCFMVSRLPNLLT